ncbi:hypothetical protein N7532_003611 [Penicillium argentinense]|uniref:DUF659 domain-containing protein n=1 Tax=Penicillium argentinense TaxID=1131581 RepID=A0A9W9KFD5_9EURO|nr:uncharacterized protein N7532_003611 [Penicillium argentinense]KAJ5103082.1 hypothetical protein N7532_003611 [Penicillium argentinense]
MIATWGELRTRDELKHVFFIPCDSHGLQLLMQDLLSLPTIVSVFKRAASIVSYFNTAHLQLAKLRALQQRFYKKELSLLAVVSTRWGTQYRMLMSVKRSEQALRAYFTTHTDLGEAGRELATVANYHKFWGQLNELLVLIEPLDEAIRMSESGGANLMKVVCRWMSLRAHIQQCQEGSSLGKDLAEFIPHDLTPRIDRQLTDLHWAAFYLDPKNHSSKTPITKRDQVIRTIQKYCVSPDNIDASAEAIDEFFTFRGRQGSFFKSVCWDFIDNPIRFWRMQVSTP